MNSCDYSYHICFYFACPCHLLLWMIWIFIAGMLVTGRMQMTAAKFYYYDLEDKADLQNINDKGIRRVNIPVIRGLELWRSYNEFSTMINALTDKMKSSIRWGLRVDYLFMLFTFGAMYLLVRWVAHCFPQTQSWYSIWHYAKYLPTLAWAMDISQNILTALILKKISKTKAQVQCIASSIKWLAVTVYLLVWTGYGVGVIFN